MILKDILAERRVAAGSNGQPLSFDKFTVMISGQKHGATMYRFIKGQSELQVKFLRLIAGWATANGDTELILAIAAYVGVDASIAPVDN